MEVFSTIVLFEERQPVYHLHFAEVAEEALTNDTWVSNYAFISMPNTLTFFILKKEKRKEKPESCKNSLCYQEFMKF